MAAPVVYRVPRRFISFPDDPPPYGLLAVSFVAHMACFGAAIGLSAFLGSRIDQSKVYIVNLVPATPTLGSPAPEAPPAARAPEPRPAPKAEEKAPPKAAPRPEPTPPVAVRPPERVVEPPPPRAAELPAPRPKSLEPSELALPKRAEKESPSLAPPTARPIERTLPPPPAVTPPSSAPVAPTAPTRLPDPPKLPEPPRIATPPSAPATPTASPSSPVPGRPATETARVGSPTAATVSGSNLSVDASDFPFTYYIRQLHAKVSERWRRPPLVSTEQTTVMIYFEIDREGQIRGQPKIKQSSGNEVYDQSALRAVMDSIPFPPLPRDFPGQYLKVNFGFNPGLDKG